MRSSNSIPDAIAYALLATAQVRISDDISKFGQPVRALCDSGSQINLITNDCCQRLGLAPKPGKITITGVGNVTALHARGFVDIFICHRINTQPILQARLIVINKITSKLPSRELEDCFIAEFKPKELADPQYHLPGKVDVLLGAGIWTKMVSGEILRKEFQSEIYLAQKTIFGWVITNSMGSPRYSKTASLHLTAITGQMTDIWPDIDYLVRTFWEVESIPERHIQTYEEKLCENIFASTHRRLTSGHYEVHIPFRPDHLPLGESKQMALRRYLQFEARCKKNPDLDKQCREFMLDYIKSGHMKEAPPAPDDVALSYYIPYHAIFNKKFRIVFDASAVTSTGISLNQIQLSGEKLQENLDCIILRFRLHEFAVSADIVKMFRQINVAEEFWNYQRILWRPAPESPIREYYILVVVWGMTSATFNSVRALRQNAIDEQENFPLAAMVALTDYYIDNLLSGISTREKLAQLCSEMIEMLSRGGFKLSQWCTNEPQMAERLKQDPNLERVITDKSDLLGMSWFPGNDKITLKISQKEYKLPDRPTKAHIVGAISRVYDPTGLFAPTILIGKMIMQDFWRVQNLDWNDKAPEYLIQRYVDYEKQIEKLTDITVNRWLHYDPNAKAELHVFCDASEKAYGAVAYLRVIKNDNSITVNVITSKSKIAPIKTQTIARLELFAAVIAVKLATYVRNAFRMEKLTTFFWTDSSIVLHWLRKDPAKMSTLVSTRVASILETSAVKDWSHVTSSYNPADMLSRGLMADELSTSSLWWNGPSWLSTSSLPFLSQQHPLIKQTDIENDIKESKGSAPASKGKTSKLPGHSLTLLSTTNSSKSVKGGDIPSGKPELCEFSVLDDQGNFISSLERRSTLAGIIRVMSYVLRFVNAIKRIRTKETVAPSTISSPLPTLDPLTPQERNQALLVWIKLVQRTAFHKELRDAEQGSPITAHSSLIKLHPRLYPDDGTMRVGGRLQLANLPFDERHPIILPQRHRLVELLIQNAHFQTNHGGPQLCIATLRQRFWIIGIRIAVKHFISKKCTACIRHSKEAAQQLMAPLPAVRTEIAPPFSRVGVDFAGPFVLRRLPATIAALRKAVSDTPKGTTTIKGWVVVFVCLVTRAVHLDVAKGLDTESFLACFSRMTARRGLCSEIWSDNGTNFVGANNEIRRVLDDWNNHLPLQQLAEIGTTWKFITPGAPFQGGIWEAAVKTFKYHFYRTLGSRVLTIDQMYTLVVQIEACMNARPLFPASDDPSDLNPITPAHLVIGRSTLQRPYSEDVVQFPDNRLTLWGLQQKLYQQYWSSWKHDYIAAQQQRNKWYKIHVNLKPNDMVLIQDENTPPSKWPYGKITEVIKSKDGLVRSAKIATATTTIDANNQPKASIKIISRPVQKLCILLPDDSTPPPPSGLSCLTLPRFFPFQKFSLGT